MLYYIIVGVGFYVNNIDFFLLKAFKFGLLLGKITTWVILLYNYHINNKNRKIFNSSPVSDHIS